MAGVSVLHSVQPQSLVSGGLQKGYGHVELEQVTGVDDKGVVEFDQTEHSVGESI